MTTAEAFRQAAALIAQADGLLVGAGAGMGVDSGLPDFRGMQGFWSAYPALGRARIDFHAIASPAAFRARPRQAWGFYGHRLALYRKTVPHAGFALINPREPAVSGTQDVALPMGALDALLAIDDWIQQGKRGACPMH